MIEKSLKDAALRTEFLKIERNAQSTEEDWRLLEEYLNDTNFYQKLNHGQKKWFLNVFSHEQIKAVKRIDRKVGYVKEDHFELHAVFEALNELTYE